MTQALAAVCTALLTDLKTNAGLPTLSLSFAGREPRSIEPDDCPALAVFWAGDTTPAVPTSYEWNATAEIEIRYYEQTVAEAATLTMDITKANALTDAADLILKRLLAIWRTPVAITGAWEVRPMQGRRRGDLKFGLVDGISVFAAADITYT